MKFNLIVAMCEKSRGIGSLNRLPWTIKNDMKRFVELTTGNKNNSIIMGKNTWDSLPKKPLKNRKNIILSTSMQNTKNIQFNQIKKQQVSVFNDVNDLLYGIQHNKLEENWIIGGEQIYKEFLDLNIVSKLYITNVISDVEKYDVFFPTLSNNFKQIYKSDYITEQKIIGPTIRKYKYYYEIFENDFI
tara:strand:- start:588 stop:1151 length:564 start_codon:yes stop_codon:yes gene_type:complete